MTYESKSFKEHHLTRLPVLERLLLLGWEREQIICPSPNSDDTEWHVPKTPSEATNRESKRSFKGYPVDIALFDDVEFVNDYEHIVAIIECKEPNKNEGISQLKIYLGLEPHARLGIWTNGTEFVRVYKLPSAGDFKVVEGVGLPKPTENFILAGDKRITYSDLQIPSTRELKSAFSSLLGVITSRDTRSRSSHLEICKHTKGGLRSDTYAPTTELGIAFVERAWKILQNGGRLGIVLPETYFFSKSYRWFREWMDTHFILRGALNVPMEAFQGFCRAKTNFYVFEKIGKGEKADTPTWFKDGYVWVSNAPTIGLNKDGLDLFVVDENGSRTDVIDNKAIIDVQALMRGESTFTSGYIKSETMSKSYIAVPTFSGNKSESVLEEKVKKSLPGFKMRSLGDLIDDGIISVRGGHGSPSSDIRIGDIPYIKVVDLRAGRVNPNSTNMVPEAVAREFWHGEVSGISAWEIATPSRASKNIGEPCMILPGQERMVLTKEILLFSVSSNAPIDPFYLFWAMRLRDVQNQWQRVIFMQTNREDLGNRYRLIEIPYTDDKIAAQNVSQCYRDYFLGLYELQRKFDRMSDDF